MAFYDKFPYTNFQELNLDKIVEDIGDIQRAEEATAEYAQDANNSRNAAAVSEQNAEVSRSEASQSAAQAAASAGSVFNLRNQIQNNTDRINTIVATGTPTEGNAELIDIRTAAAGFTPASYSTAGDAVRGQITQVNDKITATNETIDFLHPDIESSPFYSTGNPTDYSSGLDTVQYCYMLNNNGVPTVIPKGAKIKRFRALSTSSADHTIYLYLMKRVIAGYVLLRKLTLNVTGNRWIDLSNIEIPTRCYIAVANMTNYALRMSPTYVGGTHCSNLVVDIASLESGRTTVFNPGTGDRYFGIDIEIIDDDKPKTYTVGEGGDYTYFTAMLRGLKGDSSEKTVYVKGGTYNIYNEMGGDDLMNSITDPSSLNWRDVCEVVPPNTHIIGQGKVLLTWNAPAAAVGSDAKAFLFSPLNVTGNCIIENIEIECTNCRYAIHDETSGLNEFRNVTHIYKNVTARKLHGTYGNNQIYAAGISPCGLYYFEDCNFFTDRFWAFSMHTTYGMTAEDKVNIVLKNVLLKHTGYDGPVNTHSIALTTTYGQEMNADVHIDNCWSFGKLMLTKENAGDTGMVNPYTVTCIGSNDLDITVNEVSNTKTLIQKNVFPNTY